MLAQLPQVLLVILHALFQLVVRLPLLHEAVSLVVLFDFQLLALFLELRALVFEMGELVFQLAIFGFELQQLPRAFVLRLDELLGVLLKSELNFLVDLGLEGEEE